MGTRIHRKQIPKPSGQHSQVTVVRRAFTTTAIGTSNILSLVQPYPPALLTWDSYCLFEYPAEWTNKLRRQIRNRDRQRCQVCHTKSPSAPLEIHHINYDKRDCSELNLITLCGTCHNKTNSHRQLQYREFYQVMTRRFPEYRLNTI